MRSAECEGRGQDARAQLSVFQHPFQMIQELTIDAAVNVQAMLVSRPTVAINGILTYQACDDVVCFPPESQAPAWTVRVRPLEREGPCR